MSSHRANKGSGYAPPARSAARGRVAPAHHRAPRRQRSRSAAVVLTTIAGAGILAIGSAAATPQRLLPGTALGGAEMMSDGSALSYGSAVATFTLGDGLAGPRGGLVANPGAAVTATHASRGSARAARPTFARPGSGVLTSCFCWRWGAFHDGIDLAAPLGSPIFAATAGVVTRAGPDGGYGNLIMIAHAGGALTFYGHEEKILVKVGQHVTAGQRIALVGNLGYSTGPHLHFGVRVNGVGVDPVPWLARHGVKI